MMKLNPRLVIFVLVILAVGVIFAVPYLNQGSNSPGKSSPGLDQVPAKFSTTDRPAEKLRQAMAQGTPVFLEFYAKW
ncbi:MAG TPA: hypothetical protein VNT57_04440 [Desulfobacteria bacterium]|nr:hypothetical protein [Desulfobacteria bacterium]